MKKNKKENQKIVLERKSKSGKKQFHEPSIRVYSKLEDITLFTSVSNVSGTTFF